MRPLRIPLLLLALLGTEASWAPPPTLATLYGINDARTAQQVDAVVDIALADLARRQRRGSAFYENREDFQRLVDFSNRLLQVQAQSLGPSHGRLLRLSGTFNDIVHGSEPAWEMTSDGHNDALQEVSFTKEQRNQLKENSVAFLVRSSRVAATREEYLRTLLLPFTPDRFRMPIPPEHFRAMFSQNGKLLRPEFFPNGGPAELLAAFYAEILREETEKDRTNPPSDPYYRARLELRAEAVRQTAQKDFVRIAGYYFGGLADIRSNARGTEAAKTLEAVRKDLTTEKNKFVSSQDVARREYTVVLLGDVARGGITPAVRLYRKCRRFLWDFGGI